MTKNWLLLTLIFTALFVFALPTTWALPYTVTLDVSSIAGSDFELLFELFDNDFIINTSLLIDNVFISDASGLITPPGMIDFESGTFEGFVPDPLDPGVASIVSGGFTGGSYLLQLVESTFVNPTITFRDFIPSTATTLQFDFELVTPSDDDSVVAYILDPLSGYAPFSTIPGLYGLGDFLEATSAGNSLASGASASVIPEPSTILLVGFGLFGLLGISIKRWRRKQS